MSRLKRFRRLTLADKDRIRQEIIDNCDLVGDCWVYRGTKDPATDYGMKYIGGMMHTVSRFMLAYDSRESLNTADDACHEDCCPYAACCNPRHLFWASHAVNCAQRERDKREARKLYRQIPPIPLGHETHSAYCVHPEIEHVEARTIA
jgi:hypothetical protein